MTQYKTILADGAPWPDKPVEQPKVAKAAPKPRKLPPPKDASKIANTDKMFQQWAAKNLGVNT
jgi:hypothetical protein